MKNYNEEVGNRIYDVRTEKNITLKELGDLVGLSESTVQRYEKGKIKNVDIEIVKKFADALKISPAYLMGWENNTIHTIAAHKDDMEFDWTEEELEDIENFKKYVLSKRKSKE